MAWRFSSPPPPVTIGRTNIRDHVVHDPALGRYRWAFATGLERARAAAGHPLTREEAVAAIEPEVRVAVAYVDATPPDETVFGVVYEEPSGSLPGEADVGKADRERRNATEIFREAMGADAEFWMRGAFFKAAVKVLMSSVARDPNNLLAAAALVRCLYYRNYAEAYERGEDYAEEPAGPLAEWCDLYCRVGSLASVVRRAPGPDDPALVRAQRAFAASVEGGLVERVELAAGELGAGVLLDTARLAQASWLPSLGKVMEWVAYTQVHSVGWLDSAYYHAGSVAPLGGGPGTLDGVARDLRTMLELIGPAGVRGAPGPVVGVLRECVRVLALALSRETDPRIRLAACGPLGMIPLPETVEALRAHQSDPDAGVREAVGRALAAVQEALASTE